MIFSTNDNDVKFLDSLVHSKYQYLEIVDCKRMNRNALIEISLYNRTEDVTLEDCEKVTDFLMNEPEFVEKFGEESVLSVTSPGLERKLTTERELSLFKNKEVKIVYLNDSNKTTRLIGILSGNFDEYIEVFVENEMMKIDKDSIKKIKLYYQF